jgi:hypothetical protein
VIDRIELAEGKDLTSFVPRTALLEAGDYDPARVGEILPVLREAAVTRVVSLDALSHPDLGLLAEIPGGPPGILLRVYALSRGFPRAFVACRVIQAPPGQAVARAFQPDVDPSRDVVLESREPATCTRGSVALVSSSPGADEYDVETDGAGILVTRDSFAPGWTAAVAGGEAAVLRANGRHRAVTLPAGRHRVRLRYVPATLRAALLATLVAVAAAAIVAVRRR